METYKIALENEDGTYEIVKVVTGTWQEAIAEWNEAINKQCDDYHVKKIINVYRPVCILNSTGESVRRES